MHPPPAEAEKFCPWQAKKLHPLFCFQQLQKQGGTRPCSDFLNFSSTSPRCAPPHAQTSLRPCLMFRSSKVISFLQYTSLFWSSILFQCPVYLLVVYFVSPFRKRDLVVIISKSRSFKNTCIAVGKTRS